MALAPLGADSDVMAFQLLRQTQAAAYIALCSLTAVMWDWILTLAEDYLLVKGCRRTFAMLAYFIARSSAVTLCVLALIFYTGVLPGDRSCSIVFWGIGAMTVVGSAAKSYLFLLRVRAVYGNSKLVTLCVVAGLTVVVSSKTTVGFMTQTSALQLGQSEYCSVTDLTLFPVISLWLNLAYDTCIFISISARLTSHTASTTTHWNLSFVRGYGLPRTMRHLLQDGQLYYCTTLIFLLSSAIIASSPVGPNFQATFAVPAIIMETIMTCKVFRAMVLRSLDVEKNMSVAMGEGCLNATSIFECDTATM